jgi:hypothetical protein
MSIEQLEEKMFAALKTEASFQIAKSNLLLANVTQNGRGSLEDVAVFLSDDGRSVMVFANYSDDEATIYTSFELSEPTTEETFDGHMWSDRLMQGD